MVTRYVERRVVKHGGSGFKDFDGYRLAADYLIGLSEKGKKVIGVVSAPKGVTDYLKSAWAENDIKKLTLLKEKYGDEFISGIKDSALKDKTFREIEANIAFGVDSLASRKGKDRFMAEGESHSGILLKAALIEEGYPALFLDGYQAGVMVSPLGTVLENLTEMNIRSNLKEQLDPDARIIPVIGGFVGKSIDNDDYKLMGRNSTDVTGIAVACSIGAELYEIAKEKETPGIFRVEPEFGETGILPKISYDEASHITSRGAKVVHPLAVTLAKRNRIPIRVMSIENTGPGTIIGTESLTTYEHPVAALSAGHFYIITIVDETMTIPEGLGYLSRATGIPPKYGVEIIDNNGPHNTISMMFSEKDEFVEVDGEKKSLRDLIKNGLDDYGYTRSEIYGRTLGGICLTGEKMKGRPNTVCMLSGILGDADISINTNMQIPEDVTEPSITFYIDKGKLKEGVSAFCRELF